MATAKEVMEKRAAAQVAKPAAQAVKVETPVVSAPVAPVTAEVKPTWTPPPRTCSYVSRAPNTKITLGDKSSFTFKGNYYTTSDSKEIYELDSLCSRQPNVFSKSA